MKTGPDIALIASLMGDPGRANMLSALAGGKALTASELATEAGVSLPTASSHLSKLQSGGLIEQEKIGRHRYFRLSGPDIASVLEGLMGLAMRVGHTRVRTGPKDPALRHARVCYDHLAGDLGVAMYDGLQRQRLIATENDAVRLTRRGEAFMAEFGVDLDAARLSRRPMCKSCLDWSVRRHHLAGAVGSALLDQLYVLRWARRESNSRIVTFSPIGEAKFRKLFGSAVAA